MKKNLINFNYQVNKLLVKKGKSSKAGFIFEEVLLLLVKEIKKNPLNIMKTAVDNIMPIFLLKNKKIGKRVIIIPSFILSVSTRRALGLKWLIEASLKKRGSFSKNLAFEILEAFHNRGVVKKRQKDLNLLVLENKSNLKYRW